MYKGQNKEEFAAVIYHIYVQIYTDIKVDTFVYVIEEENKEEIIKGRFERSI